MSLNSCNITYSSIFLLKKVLLNAMAFLNRMERLH